MNIIKYLKSLFNKENNAYLINGYASFAIPKRDVLNEKQIEILTTAKEEYLGLLKNNIFTSLDLEIDDINNKREMYTKLLLNNMMNETKNNKVLSIKLKNYESDLINLRETLLIRLIALSEIVNQNRFKKRTKEAIINEIGKIQLSLVTIDSQIVSIHNEIEAYLSNPQKGLDLDKRICDLEKLSEDIVEKCGLSSKEAYIAYLERSLEIYCYKNKEEVNSLKDELDSLRCSEINSDNINSLKERINKLEKMYNIYYEFDRNTITKEDMYSLYEAKFYIYAYDYSFKIYNGKDDIFSSHEVKFDAYSFRNYNSLENEVYLDIISKKINTLLNGNSPYLINFVEKNSVNKLAYMINNIKFFLMNNDQFDFEEILNNKYKLLLLLSLDDVDGLTMFFKNTKVDIYDDVLFNNDMISNNHYKSILNYKDSNEDCLYYHVKLPLSTVLKLCLLNNEKDENVRALIVLEYWGTQYDFGIFPEGILSGNISNKCYDYFLMMGNVLMPKSLIDISMEAPSKKTNIVFQNGTKLIEIKGPTPQDGKPLQPYGTCSITLPSSVKLLKTSELAVNSITFEDYKNSELLNCDSIKEKIELVNNLFIATYYLKVCATFKPRYNTIILKSDDEEHIISSDDFEYYVDVIQSDNFKETTAVKFYNEFCEKYHIDSTEKRKVK